MVLRLRRRTLHPCKEIKVIDWEALLEIYTLEEVLALGDLTDIEVLEFLAEEGFLRLPDIGVLDGLAKKTTP